MSTNSLQRDGTLHNNPRHTWRQATWRKLLFQYVVRKEMPTTASLLTDRKQTYIVCSECSNSVYMYIQEHPSNGSWYKAERYIFLQLKCPWLWIDRCWNWTFRIEWAWSERCVFSWKSCQLKSEIQPQKAQWPWSKGPLNINWSKPKWAPFVATVRTVTLKLNL